MGEPPRRRGPARTLSEADLLAAALRAVDAGGPAALSLRRVAADLGITANAVYTYFPTKRHLEHALVDDLLRRAATASHRGRGRGRVLASARALRALLLEHPAAMPLVLAAPFTGPGGLALGERVLDDLTGLGLDLPVASRCAYALIGYALGTVALDAAELPPGTPRPADEEVTARRRSALADAAVAPPATAATLDVVAQYNSEAQYLWGIERILDGALASTAGGGGGC